ncbi:MAG: hypothetical protein M1814_002248 [Vezdaea aestivalis]|nr:MAG: hypothetical protein M1814_002248 [Vezdaea aestivalis]
MAATHLWYQQTDILLTPGFLSAAIESDENHNPFDYSFRASKRPEASSSTGSGSNAGDEFLQPLVDCTFSPLFAFTPNPSTPKPDLTKSINPSMLPRFNSDLAPNQAWAPTSKESALQYNQFKQEPSPPQSARSLSDAKEDHLPGSNPNLKTAQQMTILEAVSAEVRSTLSQITLTSDASLSPQEPQAQPELSKKGKSWVASRSAAEPAPTPKRQCKLSIPSKKQVSKEPERPEGDVKRNRFLERNRVAASKCRQKKKEWTDNLESGARELRKENTQLTLVVSSLKNEMLFLKGELLKHSSCDCNKIRQYLDNEAAHFAANPTQIFSVPDGLSPIDPISSQYSRSNSMSVSDHGRSEDEHNFPV